MSEIVPDEVTYRNGHGWTWQLWWEPTDEPVGAEHGPFPHQDLAIADFERSYPNWRTERWDGLIYPTNR